MFRSPINHLTDPEQYQLAPSVGKEEAVLRLLFRDKGLGWSGLGQELLAQAVREAEVLQAIPSAIANLHQPCRHRLFRMRNLWRLQWRN